MVNMSKSVEKLKALKLRRDGMSIRDIAKALNVSKGSASLWCRNISLTEEQQQKILVNGYARNLKGRMIGAAMNKQKKIDRISQIESEVKKEITTLTRRDQLMIAIGLFWSEGSKTGSNFVFANSDPKMIMFMYTFLTKILKIKKEDIVLGLQINLVHRHRVENVLLFWSKLLNLPLNQFNNPYYIRVKPKKIYENFDNYYGLVRLKVRRGSGVHYKMLSYLKVLKEYVDVAQVVGAPHS